jgi:host factor-I protein
MGEESETHYLGMRHTVGSTSLSPPYLWQYEDWVRRRCADPHGKGLAGGLGPNPADETTQEPKKRPVGQGPAGTKMETTAMAAAQNLQDTFLNHVRKNKIPLTIFLVNGVKLQGVVTWFDNFCVLLRRDGHSQLVYKHAISTIMPGHPVQLFEGAEEPPAGEKT